MIGDPNSLIDGVDEIFQLIEMTFDKGTQMRDEMPNLMWGFVNAFHAQINRIERQIDTLKPELEELQRAQDGSEINSFNLELTLNKIQGLNSRRDIFESMRDEAAARYTAVTGNTWRPYSGSFVSLNKDRKMTASSIDAKEYLKAQKEKRLAALAPDGTLIALTGDCEDAEKVTSTLELVRQKYPDMVLVHGNHFSAEKHATDWCANNKINQIVASPDWDKHKRAAPFARNTEVIAMEPKALIAWPGTPVRNDLVKKASEAGVFVWAQ